MFTYKDKMALVTGASAGIGAEFAEQLAEKGANLILVARREDRLKALAEQLSQKYKVKVSVFAADLSNPIGVKGLIESVRLAGLKVDMLVNNAGFGAYGQFEKTEPERHHEMAMLNVVALLDLTAAFIPDMLSSGSGAIINVASTAGHQPVPFMATYAASKAFVLSFSEALWYEYKDRGVRVLSLDPGFTKSEFHDVSGTPEFGRVESAEAVVKLGLHALGEGRPSVISGLDNWLLSDVLPRLAPREAVVNFAGKIMQPKS